MQVELLCAQESIRLLRRDPRKYYTLISALYFGSFINFKTARLTRAGYFLFRHLDDVLDGDCPITADPLDYASSIRHQIESGSFNGSQKIARLAQYYLQNLKGRAKPTDNPKQDFLNGVDALLFDYLRAKDRRVLSSAELDAYYWDTFSPFINLLLIGTGSKFRANDVPELSYGQGRVYSVRDLEIDWGRGVINVPKDVLDSAGLMSGSQVTSVKESPTINRWFTDELQKNKNELLELQKKLEETPEMIPSRMCKGVLRANDRIYNQINHRR